MFMAMITAAGFDFGMCVLMLMLMPASAGVFFLFHIINTSLMKNMLKTRFENFSDMVVIERIINRFALTPRSDKP